MTRKRAREILRRVWGGFTILNKEEVKELESVEMPNETALSTLQRVGEDNFDWRKYGSFSFEAREYFRRLPE